MFNSGNPAADAQDYLRYYDNLPPMQEAHKCDSCEEIFYQGSKIEDEYFCKECIKQFKHFDFYRELGLTDSEIFNLVEHVLLIA